MNQGLTIVPPPVVGEALRRLEAQGFQAWCVGGCVRDLLLGRTPGDWDVCTDARPERVMALFPRTVRRRNSKNHSGSRYATSSRRPSMPNSSIQNSTARRI